ncbi:MAG: hypothetical protein C4583_07665 [Anaerolineaceae bacterium]|nr:MAG: hypothetical protein C4583_07665 [Anaerolineaceae bacterium]
MEFDWSRVIPIIAGLIALIVGWAIGFFDSKMRADKKIRQAEERSELAIQQAKGEAERAALATQAARAAAEAKPTLPGTTLLRLWLDSSERPALDLDGQHVETNPISETDRKRLLALLTVMRPWIEGRSTAPAPSPTPSSAPAPAMPRPVVPSAPVPVPTPRPLTAAAKDEKPATAINIVAQIDEILQARLARSPLANHAVRITESPEGGVIVWVGLQKFMGASEVTDPEVKAIIQAAISEWEKKYTPGL